MMEKQLKHLEFIQATILRMASNSFLIKGWSITIIVGLFVLSARDSKPIFALIPLLPVMAFWLLDAYYLRQERLLRCLYDQARKSYFLGGDNIELFSMSTKSFSSNVDSGLKILFSRTIFWFHGILLLVIILVNIGIYRF